MLIREPRSARPVRILISGWYGVDNVGDDAILEQFIREMVAGKNVELLVLCRDPDGVDRRYRGPQVRGLYHADLVGLRGLACWRDGSARRVIDALRSCDLFVLGGGGLLRDNTNWANLIRLLDDIWLIKLFGAKAALYAIGAGPFRSRLGRWFIHQSIRLCDVITVREPTSKGLLEDLGVLPERVRLVTDPAVLLEPAPFHDPELLAIATDPQTVGFYVEEDFEDALRLAPALDQLHEQLGVRFLAIPLRCHPGNDDRALAARIQAAMRHPAAMTVSQRSMTAGETKWLIGQIPLNLTLRLHAMIFSLSMGRPVVAVNYEPKVSNVIRGFGLGEFLVEPDANMSTNVVTRVAACRKDLERCERRVHEALVTHRKSAQLTFQYLREVLPRRSDSGAQIGEMLHYP